MNKKIWNQLMISFFIATACICILEGLLGIFFLPDETLGYGAFLSPPFLGFLSVIFGLVTKSRHDMSVKEVLIRKGIHLLLIETLVFGLNYLVGNQFTLTLDIVLVIGIALVYACVNYINYLNDRRYALAFNAKLKEYQNKAKPD